MKDEPKQEMPVIVDVTGTLKPNQVLAINKEGKAVIYTLTASGFKEEGKSDDI